MNTIIFLSHDARDDEDARRQVRSKAAQHSHRIGPRKPKVSKKGRGKLRAGRPRLDEEGQRQQQQSLDSSLEPACPRSRRGSSISVATSASTVPGTSTEGEASPSLTPPIVRLGGFRDQPFDVYPVPGQPWFPEVLDYMWTFMLRGWQALPTTATERDEGLLWVKRLAMSSPSYFYMNLLSVMSDLVSQGRKPHRFIVWLSSEVVTSINKALSDPQEALAPGTIFSVGRLALREIMIGDMNAGVTYHRPAWARMMVLAGGLKKMGVPPLVRKHVAWSNRLMRMKTGVSIGDLEPVLAGDDGFEGSGMDVDTDVKVLDSYLPNRQRLMKG